MAWRELMNGVNRFMDEFDERDGRSERRYGREYGERREGGEYEEGFEDGYEEAMRKMSEYGERRSGENDGYGERRGVKGTGRYSRYRR